MFKIKFSAEQQKLKRLAINGRFKKIFSYYNHKLGEVLKIKSKSLNTRISLSFICKISSSNIVN
ncbi:MAG: hypothetical protein CMP11_06910 [Zetaproteobacteria bacterium]|nr:hypothetical protein [Pseudobdellovibrionaceae bacterium]